MISQLINSHTISILIYASMIFASLPHGSSKSQGSAPNHETLLTQASAIPVPIE